MPRYRAPAEVRVWICMRNKPVRRVFRFAMEPDMKWAFKPDTTESAHDREKAEKRRLANA